MISGLCSPVFLVLFIRCWTFDVRSSSFSSSFPFSFYDLNSSPSAPLYGNGNAGEAVTIARTAGSFKTAKLKDVPKVQGIPLNGGIGFAPVTPIYCGFTIPDRRNFLPREFRL
jgi:hypothetical protein